MSGVDVRPGKILAPSTWRIQFNRCSRKIYKSGKTSTTVFGGNSASHLDYRLDRLPRGPWTGKKVREKVTTEF